MADKDDVCKEIEGNQEKILADLQLIFKKYDLDVMLVVSQRTHPTGVETIHTHQSAWLISPDKETGSLLMAGDMLRIQQHACNLVIEHAANLIEQCARDIVLSTYKPEKDELVAVQNLLTAQMASNAAQMNVSGSLIKRTIDSLRAKIDQYDLEEGEAIEGVEPKDEPASEETDDEELIQKVQAMLRKHGKLGVN